jgi:chromosome segregation ATPase
MSDIQPKVGMWVQIPKLTKKQEKQLNYEINVKSGKNYQILDCYNSTNNVARSWVEIEDEDGVLRTFHLKDDLDLLSKPLILLDENQQPLTTKKQTVKEESKPQITAQEMYIKELEKTAKSLREQLENLEEEVAIRDKVITNANKDIEHLENKLDEAYKEQEELNKAATRMSQNIFRNLVMTLKNTGVLNETDVAYFCDVAVRLYNHKYVDKAFKDSEEN